MLTKKKTIPAVDLLQFIINLFTSKFVKQALLTVPVNLDQQFFNTAKELFTVLH